MLVRCTKHGRLRVEERVKDHREFFEALGAGHFVTLDTNYRNSGTNTVLLFSLTEQKFYLAGIFYDAERMLLATCYPTSPWHDHKLKITKEIKKKARDTRMWGVLNEEKE